MQVARGFGATPQPVGRSAGETLVDLEATRLQNPRPTPFGTGFSPLDDVLNGGPGQDILDPGPGNNVTIQSAVGNPSADGSQAAALLGQFMASTFVASGASDATPVADPAMIQQPLLAQPHA